MQATALTLAYPFASSALARAATAHSTACAALFTSLTHGVDAQTDLQKGYFDDFKELRDTQGRVFEPDTSLSLARTATAVPELQVLPC